MTTSSMKNSSVADEVQSIPPVMDDLKPGQCKILHTDEIQLHQSTHPILSGWQCLIHYGWPQAWSIQDPQHWWNNFINQELILYLVADSIWSIPSVMDGFKPGQHKILVAVSSINWRIKSRYDWHNCPMPKMLTSIITLTQDFIASVFHELNVAFGHNFSFPLMGLCCPSNPSALYGT